MSFANYGDWTDRIAKGELPFAKPPRPQGVERNIVVTLRDWMNEKQYLHDLIASDRRFPTVNAHGPVYGSPQYSSDMLPILDPVKNVATTFQAPVQRHEHAAEPGPRPRCGARSLQPSPDRGRRAHLGDAREQSQLDVRPRRSGVPRGVGARPRESGLPQAGSDHPSARPSRWSAPCGTSRCSIRRPRGTPSWTPASRRIICSSVTTRMTPSGRAAGVPSWAGSTRSVRPDRRRGEVVGMAALGSTTRCHGGGMRTRTGRAG